MRVLFIGNSYTYYNDMPEIFRLLSVENGIEVSVYSVTKGGRKLFKNLDPCDENNERIRDIIKNGGCDVLFLQEQSHLPISDYDAFENGASAIKDLVKAKRTILYSTWGRKRGAYLLTELNLSSEEMTDKLGERYSDLAAKIGAEVSHVGTCFKFIAKKYPELELYNPDLSHPSYLGSAVAAACHYYTLFAKKPLNFSHLSLTCEEIAAIKSALNSLK